MDRTAVVAMHLEGQGGLAAQADLPADKGDLWLVPSMVPMARARAVVVAVSATMPAAAAVATLQWANPALMMVAAAAG